eukprot:gene29910-36120_t
MFFCADEEATGLTGKLSRIILVQIPAFWRKVIISICGKSAFSSIYSVYDYTVNKRNPIMQGMYLVIINAAFLSWIILVSPEVPMRSSINFLISLYVSLLSFINVHINTERLNQCVGELNYRYFLLFLLVNASFFFYGAYVMVMVMFSEIEQKRLMHTVFVNRTTGE